MAYGSALVDTIQSSTAATPVVFKDGNGTQIGTLCRAWVKFVGSTAVISSSFNVSSITRNATGNYTVNYTTALSNSNYSLVGTVSRSDGAAAVVQINDGLYSTTQSAILVYGVAAGGIVATFDPTIVNVSVFD